MTVESTRYYFPNPTIYLFPRGLKYLLKEEKKTVDGVETIEKKCELNEILTTYADDNEYCFAGKYFKEIEKRIYLDLNKITNNECTVTKKLCVGFLSKQGDTYKFTDKNAIFYNIDLMCESTDSNITAYLKYDDTDNSADPKTPISINMINVENRIKEFSVVIKYSADTIPPAKADLKIYAKHANSNDWKATFVLKLYRNTENSLNGFKQSSDKDTDFFILPIVNPSANQKKCIKQLQILNNQVFARNASLTDFTFIEESGEIVKTTVNGQTTTTEKIYEKMATNARNSLAAFKYNPETNTGCKSGNDIYESDGKKLKSDYLYNFSNYGQQKNFIEYLNNEYSVEVGNLQGRIYDRNFLFGKYKAGDPDSKIEGIVNLYTEVVVKFISNTIVEANKYLNFPNRWLSCPKFNPNYHRGEFEIKTANKNLYSSINNSTQTAAAIYTLSSINGYNGNNNLLPIGTKVRFVIGRDKYAYKINELHCYEINEIKFPGQIKFHSVPQRLWIELSDNEKKTCMDTDYDENFSNYVSDTRVSVYNNNGVPYFISDTYQPETTDRYGGKHTYNDFLNMNMPETGHSWYSYTPRPSMNDNTGIGLDCSGLVTNCICDCNGFSAFSITDNDRKNGINVGAYKDTICRKITNNNSPYNGLLQKGDVIMSVFNSGKHIVICDEGNVKSNFSNTYITQSNFDTADVQVIHNYGATLTANENNYVKTDSGDNSETITNGCFMKTLRGPYKHTGIKLKAGQNISSNITLGRIYLWKKD